MVRVDAQGSLRASGLEPRSGRSTCTHEAPGRWAVTRGTEVHDARIRKPAAAPQTRRRDTILQRTGYVRLDSLVVRPRVQGAGPFRRPLPSGGCGGRGCTVGVLRHTGCEHSVGSVQRDGAARLPTSGIWTVTPGDRAPSHPHSHPGRLSGLLRQRVTNPAEAGDPRSQGWHGWGWATPM